MGKVIAFIGKDKRAEEIEDLKQEIALFEGRMKYIFTACYVIRSNMRRLPEESAASNIQTMLDCIGAASIEHKITASNP